MVSRKGKFITIEGLDGCGKSTQLAKLADFLRAQRMDVLVTREPGGTLIGDRIRALLLDSATSGLAPTAEMALMFAARAQHLEELILPALAQGKIVLCDRFTDSTEAYQGAGRRLGSGPVLELHRLLCGDIWPAATVLMDTDAALSVSRARRRNRGRSSVHSEEPNENRFEEESRAFFERVRAAYLEIARREPDRVIVIDARGTPDATHQAIVRALEPRLNLRAKTG